MGFAMGALVVVVAGSWAYWLWQGGLGTASDFGTWLQGLGTPIALVALFAQAIRGRAEARRQEQEATDQGARADRLEEQLDGMRTELRERREDAGRIATTQARPLLVTKASRGSKRSSFTLQLCNVGGGPAHNVQLRVGSIARESLDPE